VKACPNCGWSNEDENRFCENCGAEFEGMRAQGRESAPATATWGTPRPRPISPYEIDPTSEEWRMAPLPPEEPFKPRGRRLWLWFLSAILLVCLILCASGFIWLSYTDSGRNFQTAVAERETETAGN
jgi:hypothetical protein